MRVRRALVSLLATNLTMGAPELDIRRRSASAPTGSSTEHRTGHGDAGPFEKKEVPHHPTNLRASF